MHDGVGMCVGCFVSMHYVHTYILTRLRHRWLGFRQESFIFHDAKKLNKILCAEHVVDIFIIRTVIFSALPNGARSLFDAGHAVLAAITSHVDFSTMRL